jgi:hypothetical protein
MAGIGLNPDDSWLTEQSLGAPDALRERVMCYVAEHRGPLPERLGAAARTALDAVLAHPGDRSVALDLLAADALVTLALKAQAKHDPRQLARFAAELLGD